MGAPEIVVKRARPCSSTLVPVAAPIARSGALSRVGKSVFSAQFFSPSEGWRFSNTSATGLSATCGLEGFFSGMRTLVYCCDDREAGGRGERAAILTNDRSVSHYTPELSSCVKQEVRNANFLRSRRIPFPRVVPRAHQGVLTPAP